MFSLVKIKDEITIKLIDIVKKLYNYELSFDKVYSLLEVPNKKEYGDLSFPVFFLSKVLKRNPVEIAKEIKNDFDKSINNFDKDKNDLDENKVKSFDVKNNYNILDVIDEVSFVSGFLNFKFDKKIILQKLFKEFVNNKNNFKISEYFKDFKMVMDYSAPNIAKPFGIGHLISTTLGESIKRLYQIFGAEVIGINYIGDWGTQFGKVITAYQMWGDEKELEKRGIYYLYELYVKFHKEEEKFPELFLKAKENFKKLESYEEDVFNLWKKFREISLKEFDKLYQLLNINIDLIEGESKYNKESIQRVIEIIDVNGILEESEGAKVVFLNDVYNEEIPPCIIITKDGTTIYAVRDIAALLDRWERFKFDRIIYVTGVTQTLHFKQVFGVIKKLNFPFKDKLFHIPFGIMRFRGEKMATRKGKLIFLKDVYDRVYKRALEITEQKNISENPEDTANKLTAGALNFSILKNSRIKDIDFDFDNVLSFEGDTSVYLQYTVSRINSILEKIEKDSLNIKDTNNKNIDKLFSSIYFNNLVDNYKELYYDILSFEQVLLEAAKTYEPYILSRHVLRFAKQFNSFYTKEKVLVDDIIERNLKIIFILMVKDILQKSLNILNVPIPEKL